MNEAVRPSESTPLRKIALFAGIFYWAYDLLAKHNNGPTLDQVSPFWAGIVLVIAGLLVLRYGFLWLKEASRDRPMTPLYVAAGLFVLGFAVLAWWIVDNKAKDEKLQKQLTTNQATLDTQLAAAKANYESQLSAATVEANRLPKLLAERQLLEPKIKQLNALIKTASNKLGEANNWFQELNRSTRPVEKRSATAPDVLMELGAEFSAAISYAVETGMEEIKLPKFKPLNEPVTHGIGMDRTFSRSENEPYVRELRAHMDAYEATIETVRKHGRDLEDRLRKAGDGIRGESARLRPDAGR